MFPRILVVSSEMERCATTAPPQKISLVQTVHFGKEKILNNMTDYSVSATNISVWIFECLSLNLLQLGNLTALISCALLYSAQSAPTYVCCVFSQPNTDEFLFLQPHDTKTIWLTVPSAPWHPKLRFCLAIANIWVSFQPAQTFT